MSTSCECPKDVHLCVSLGTHHPVLPIMHMTARAHLHALLHPVKSCAETRACWWVNGTCVSKPLRKDRISKDYLCRNDLLLVISLISPLTEKKKIPNYSRSLNTLTSKYRFHSSRDHVCGCQGHAQQRKALSGYKTRTQNPFSTCYLSAKQRQLAALRQTLSELYHFTDTKTNKTCTLHEMKGNSFCVEARALKLCFLFLGS